MNLYSACLITLGFTKQTEPNRLDFKQVSNKKTNQILYEILLDRKKLICGNDFLILVDGSRYAINILSSKNKYVFLKQSFLHYNGRNLDSVSFRYVKIFL